MPDTYSYIINGEKEYDHPLPYDVIEKQKYYQNTFLINNIEEVKMKSMERVKSNTEFNLIDENAKRLAKNREESEYPLELNKYKSLVKQRTEEVKNMKNRNNSDSWNQNR